MSNPPTERSDNRAIDRREWLTRTTNLAVASLLVSRSSAQQRLLPLQTSGLDHLSLTVPDSLEAAKFYGRSSTHKYSMSAPESSVITSVLAPLI